MSEIIDVAVIGAGAAGMMCASVAGQRGKSVVLIDHAEKLAEKIRISGGGRCNFTNVDASPQNFLSQNPHFCRSALSRYTPQDFIALVKRYNIPFHEKHKGQLFCDRSAEDVIFMLKAECDLGGVRWMRPVQVKAVGKDTAGFRIGTSGGDVLARQVVIAKHFDIPMIAPEPGLVPLTFDAQLWERFVPLAGIAIEVDIATGEKKARGQFREDLLFTHRGLSGPAVLQISSFWREGATLMLNLLPGHDVAQALIEGKHSIRKNLGNWLAQLLPNRLAEGWLLANQFQPDARLADLPDKKLRQLGESLNRWTLTPNGSEGYRKAEVTLGGVDTRALSQQTMMVNTVPGLYFVGEAVDVTGWLGGYNFQWAWASGVAAGLSV